MVCEAGRVENWRQLVWHQFSNKILLDTEPHEREHAAVINSMRALPLLTPLLLIAIAPNAGAERLRGSYVVVDQPTVVAEGDDIPRVIYLNRCEGGCTFTPGADDAINNVSQIVQGTSSIAAFPYGDEAWDQVVACVADQYALFNVNVTDQDPGDLPHYESVVAGFAQDIGQGSGVGGIAPFSCGGVLPNSINFTFAESLGSNPQLLCEVIAQESAHVFGMDHVMLCEDPMTYLSGCGPKKFKNIDAPCGESVDRQCQCGAATQNSVQFLTDIFGPGSLEPTAEVTIIAVGEDPAQSDGNAIAEPGEDVLIDVRIVNNGNATTEEVLFELSSGGNLKLQQPSEPVFLGAGLSVAMQLVAEVKPKACGKEVEFELTAKLAQGSWSDTGSIISGIETSTWTSSITTDAPWQADDGSNADQGAWAYGVPEQTIFAGRQMQPPGSSTGAGSPVWMTGLTGSWDESPLVGKSTLTTSTIDVGQWETVTGIEYRLWHMAFDRTGGGLDPSPDAHLVVELSKDNGSSWKQIDSVVGEEYRWTMREVSFDPITVSSQVKLRFIVNNNDGVGERLVEIGVDQITLEGGELLCTPTSGGGGCGCQTGSSPRGAWLTWLALGLFFLIRRRTKACY